MKPIISPSELVNLPLFVLIDARGFGEAFERYKQGHLEGALFVDLETQLSTKDQDPRKGGRHPLPSLEKFKSVVEGLGISNNTPVVIYDDKNGGNAAARFWWMMHHAGHNHTYVLDGGYQNAIAHGLRSSTEVHEPGAKGTFEVNDWKPATRSLEEVEAGLKRNEVTVIDVREDFRYKGEREPIDLVAGHIPGAINIPFIGNLNNEGKFLDGEALKEKYSKIIEDPSRVIVHCGSGVTACHTLLALEQAGISGASLYVGSWSEWSRSGKPIATSLD